MKFKNFFIVCLMILMVGLSVSADTVSLTLANRHIVAGLDFQPSNNNLYMLSFETSAGGFDLGPYLIPGTGYGEIGCYIGLPLKVSEKVGITLAVIPMTWQYEGMGFEVAIVGSGTISVDMPLHPSISVQYIHLPVNTDMNGWFFSTGCSENVFGIDLVASINYNEAFFFPDNTSGLGGMIDISKTLKIADKLAVKIAFQQWWNDPDVNENETVFLASLLYIF